MAASFNFTIEQGATFSRYITWQQANGDPVDLTSATAKLQVRSSKTSTQVLLEASTANGTLVLGGAAGTIAMTIPATTTAALNFSAALYDLEVTFADETVTRLLEGTVTLNREVTQ